MSELGGYSPNEEKNHDKSEIKEDTSTPEQKFGAQLVINTIQQFNSEFRENIHHILEKNQLQLQKLRRQASQISNALLLGVLLATQSGVSEGNPHFEIEKKSKSTTSATSNDPTEEITAHEKQNNESLGMKKIPTKIDEKFWMNFGKDIRQRKIQEEIDKHNYDEISKWGYEAMGTKMTVSDEVGQIFLDKYGIGDEITMRDLREIENDTNIDAGILLFLARDETQMGNSWIQGENREKNRKYQYNVGNVHYFTEEGKLALRQPKSYKEGFRSMAASLEAYRTKYRTGNFAEALALHYSRDESEELIQRRVRRYVRIVSVLQNVTEQRRLGNMTHEDAKGAIILMDNTNLSSGEIFEKLDIPKLEMHDE